MLKRILAVIISSVLISFFLSLIDFTPLEQRDPDVYYTSRAEYFLFAVYIFTIFFVVVGLPFSFLIDLFRKKFLKRILLFQYFIALTFYILTGLILGTVYHFISGTNVFFWETFRQTLGSWFIASLVYFHILWILERKLK